MPKTPDSRAEDEPAVTDEQIWMEANDRLRIAIEAEGENRTRAIEALEFEDGNQWPDDIYNQRKIQRRPTLTINMTRRVVREICNNMRQQRPRIKVHPVGDGADIDKAKAIGGLIRHIENISKASYAYDTMGEFAVKIGWGYARVVSEYVPDTFDAQELKVHAIRNPFTVYDDPTAQLPTGADRDWLLITEEMSREKFKRKYPKAENAEFRHGGPGDGDKLWESKEKIRLAEYFRIYKKPDVLFKLSDGTSIFASELKERQDDLMRRNISTAIGADGLPIQRKAYRRVVEWYRLNGRKVVESRCARDKNPIPGKWIPVVRCEGNCLDINGQVRRRGVVEDLKDTNRMLNYWRTKETEVIALAPIAPYIVATGQIDGHPEWSDANQKPYSALVYNPTQVNSEDPTSPLVPPPQRQEPVPIPAGFTNAAQSATQDLMALAGMPHDPRADMPGAVVSGAALRERQAQTDRSHFQYYDNQTAAISHIGEILLNQIPYYYSESRMQRILGEDGVPQMMAINQPVPKIGESGQPLIGATGQVIMEIKNDLTIGRYDVVMDTGPGYETKRQEGQETMLDLLKTPLGEPIVKTGADILVRNMDFAGADDLADRLLPTNQQGMNKAIQQLPKEAQGIIMALQTQMQQMQQTIQHQALELKYKGSIEAGWMQVEREKIDSTAQTKLHDTSIDAQTKVFDTHVKSVTARDVAEINAGAKMLDSNQDREHEKHLAKETAKAAEKAEKSNGSAQ